MKVTCTVFVTYQDDSEFHFDVTAEGKEHEIVATFMRVTRGVLITSNAYQATCYRPDGFEVCSYINR